MRRFLVLPVLASLLLCLPAATCSSPPPASPGANAVVPALARTTIDDQAIVFAYQALDTVASAIDLAITAGVVKPGTPKAIALANGLDGTRNWLNTASSLQKAGQADNAFAAWQQATAGLANLRLSLKK